MNANDEIKANGYNNAWRKKIGKVNLSAEYVASWGTITGFWRVVASLQTLRDDEAWADGDRPTLKAAERAALAKLLRGFERDYGRALKFCELVRAAIEDRAL